MGPDTRFHSDRWELIDWIYGMALDILESGVWKIQYRFLYFDTKRKQTVFRTRPFARLGTRYALVDAAVHFRRAIIYISPEITADHGLCLFHECMEILFADWKNRYFHPAKWDFEADADPIRHMESAIWERLTPERRDRVRAFISQEPA